MLLLLSFGGHKGNLHVEVAAEATQGCRSPPLSPDGTTCTWQPHAGGGQLPVELLDFNWGLDQGSVQVPVSTVCHLPQSLAEIFCFLKPMKLNLMLSMLISHPSFLALHS